MSCFTWRDIFRRGLIVSTSWDDLPPTSKREIDKARSVRNRPLQGCTLSRFLPNVQCSTQTGHRSLAILDSLLVGNTSNWYMNATIAVFFGFTAKEILPTTFANH